MKEAKFWHKNTLAIPLALYILSATFMIISVLLPNWSTLELGAETYEMSLWKCKGCPKLHKSWSWKCFSDYRCNSNIDDGNCMTYSAGHGAAVTYFSLEALAFISSLMLIEKLSIRLVDKDFGSYIFVHLLGLFAASGQIIAAIAWFSLNKAVFHSSGDSSWTNPILVARNGPKFAIANSILCTIAYFSLFVVICKQKRGIIIKNLINLDAKVLKVNFSWWMKIVGLFFSAALAAIIFGLGYGKWVLRISSDSSWEGGLTSCINCEENGTNTNYDCLSAVYCYDNKHSSTCALYKDLHHAGIYYEVLEGSALISFILFFQTYLSILNKKDYGIPALNYLYAILVVLLNFAASVSWFEISNARFTTKCRSQAGLDKKPKMCSTFGPYTLIVSNIFLVPMGIIFCIAYWKREILGKYTGKISDDHEIPKIDISFNSHRNSNSENEPLDSIPQERDEVKIRNSIS
ncbi:unnamed protein product [Blepharisma stoltei]|uniref:Uncharacterized protein n=1 Tax=Blepharisma stoltei TaxID=1481888 RepID=A0AAU9JZR3_9CILI|nr:unnamed protein product [Blepharisma stoltei]